MKGLYINSGLKDKAVGFLETLDVNFGIVDIPVLVTDGFIIYDKNEWALPPFFYEKERELFIGVYGWFIYKGVKNSIKEFAQDFYTRGKNILKEIDGGIFLIYIKKGKSEYLINDILGLSNHYYNKKMGKINVAPSTYFYDNKEIDSRLDSFLNEQSHLIGNYTRYKDIFRVDPGSIYFSSTQSSKYFIPSIGEFDNLKFLKRIRNLGNFWDKKQRVLPLSGGLDSRLLLACNEYYHGYSYGPSKCKERKIANRYKDEFEKFSSYSIEELEMSKLKFDKMELIFEGVSKNPLVGLINAYQYAYLASPKSYVDFDGFLLDVFQRGTYLNFNGIKGNICKLFPSLYLNSLNYNKTLQILKKRYSKLSHENLNFLLKEYRNATESLNLDFASKLTYFEVFYGRGTRFITNGGIVMKSQYFTVATPLAMKKIIIDLFSLDLVKSAKHVNLNIIWKEIPVRYSKYKTDALYNPMMIPFVSRFLKLYAQTMKKILRIKNFAFELDNINFLMKKK